MPDQNYFMPESLFEIEQMVQYRTEENTRLDFKRQLPRSDKNDDIAKDLSALANTQGGVLIYGIVEDNGIAMGLNPIPLKGTPERLQSISRNIDGPVEIQVMPLIETEPGVGFLVVVIPISQKAPHVCKGTVWGRAGKTNVRLTRHEIGILFARSDGFAEEFGVGTPGRLKLDTTREDYRLLLTFTNDGSRPIKNADWSWEGGREDPESPGALGNPFPLANMPPGSHITVTCLLVDQTRSEQEVVTEWYDEIGLHHTESWPISIF